MFFSKNSNGNRKATVISNLKDEPKHNVAAIFLRVQSISEDDNSFLREIQNSQANTHDVQQQHSGIVTVVVLAYPSGLVRVDHMVHFKLKLGWFLLIFLY